MRRIAELLPERYRGAYGPGSEGEIVVARGQQAEGAAEGVGNAYTSYAGESSATAPIRDAGLRAPASCAPPR